jgi:hypothetical protein
MMMKEMGMMLVKSMGMIFTKFTNVQQYCVQISCTEFHPNRKKCQNYR